MITLQSATALRWAESFPYAALLVKSRIVASEIPSPYQISDRSLAKRTGRVLIESSARGQGAVPDFESSVLFEC